MESVIRTEAEIWAYRADLAEKAVRDRHVSKLWGLPRTALGVVSWPAVFKDKAFIRWHYWWQAHYLDCQVDALLRLPSHSNVRKAKYIVRAIQVRGGNLSKNPFYDDRAWMLLAMDRLDEAIGRTRERRSASALRTALDAGRDRSLGVLPWQNSGLFFNVPANGPAAIALARADRLEEAAERVDWVFENLIDQRGLVQDGVRLTAAGQEIVPDTFTYNQGVVIGACLELVLRLRDAGHREQSVKYLTRIHKLVHATAMHLATPNNVIKGTPGADGGLFDGILARYLAQCATRLPDDDRVSRATRRICARLVMSSAEAAWQHRLEVDGLPLFPAEWSRNAVFPQGGGLSGGLVVGTPNPAKAQERNLSVQLSGWKLMEAAAVVSTQTRDSEDT